MYKLPIQKLVLKVTRLKAMSIIRSESSLCSVKDSKDLLDYFLNLDEEIEMSTQNRIIFDAIFDNAIIDDYDEVVHYYANVVLTEEDNDAEEWYEKLNEKEKSYIDYFISKNIVSAH